MPPRRRPPPAGARTDLPPLKIVRKIFVLQAAYYVSAAALILFTTLVYGTAFSLDLVLGWDAIRGDTTLGWMLGLVWMLNSLLCVMFLLLLVSRSKLIPDFALTIHFLHLLTTSLYTRSIPSNWLWWGLQCGSAALMTFLGVWACQWRELRPISFGSLTVSGNATQTSNAVFPSRVEEHSEPFLSGRSRGRGRNVDGGEYEMTDIKGDQAV
ncbi:hypothetical protein P175DRAFT_0445645 [Aspergillus ochraceoroseus IBT 24754]|uniref:Protein SYS1 n=1 Tax=Aspergillus ochraceoroseus IBT 24754 TaxID=1392256 RepID=A0A2T5LMC5_9EURO|nr:uncharacterized protein P175DRAFT_0445645 [Aspergillus ochraceoroseus IBT 24754]PTU17427.1 hypothetical protein P175DRAFT_0445645 [Aspergillus ochraceoroseus IBT 24754]